MGVVYSNLEYLVIGLSWQSLGLVYMVGGRQEKQMVITGNEAVAKSIADTIRITSSVPLNRDDESRTEAIERELIKLGSEVMRINNKSHFLCCFLNSPLLLVNFPSLFCLLLPPLRPVWSW